MHPYRSTLLAPALAGLLLLGGPLACDDGADRTGGSSDLTVTDPTGRTVTLEAPARRIVSMIPAVTEWVVAMGAADRLVARTDYDDQPGLDHLPSVGGGLTPSIEWLAARSPDLVVSWPDAPSRSIVARLEQVGISVYTAPIESIDQALSVARDLGTLLDLRPAASSATRAVRVGLDSVRAAVAGRPTPDVLYLIGLDPLMAAGPGTFVDELLTAAGARNVLHDLDILWPNLSLEEVVRRAPDVIIVGSAHTPDPADLLAQRPGWRDVPAVHTSRVHAVDPDVVNRPGPHLHEAATLLATLIHPSMIDDRKAESSAPEDEEPERQKIPRGGEGSMIDDR